MPKVEAKMSVLSVGSMVQVQVHGATFVVTAGEAWDLGCMLKDASGECDDPEDDQIDWDATRRAAETGCDIVLFKKQGW